MPNVPEGHVYSSPEVVVADASAPKPQPSEEIHEISTEEAPRNADLREEPPPAVAPEPRASADILPQILSELKALGEEFSLKLKYDQAKEKAVDALHDELRQHRGGLHFTLLRPLLSDLISLHDDLLQLADAKKTSDPQTARTFEGLGGSIKEILARQGVSTLEVQDDVFDRKRQRAIRTVATDQQDLVGSVAERLRAGFIYDDRIVRPEHVAVYVLHSTPGPSGSAPRPD